MRLVVDASVAVKWFVEEEYSAEAGRLLESDYELHAPRLLTLEVGNALWRKARVGELERNRAGALAAIIPDMPVRWAEDDDYCPDAVLLALALDRTVYDSLYLALAHRIRARLVTADARFVNALAATEHGGAVVALHDLALA